MESGKKVKKSKEELTQDLRDQLSLLISACKTYDEGLDVAALHISVSLRVLLHDNGRQSKSLLDQLGERDKRFYDTAGKINPKNLASEINLVRTAWRRDTLAAPLIVKYEPKLDAISPHKPVSRIPFAEWWNSPIIKDRSNNTLTRRELVRSVADQDGGAHVDLELNSIYHKISRLRSAEMARFYDETGTIEISNRLELACIRQIAHETLRSVEHNIPNILGQ